MRKYIDHKSIKREENEIVVVAVVVDDDDANITCRHQSYEPAQSLMYGFSRQNIREACHVCVHGGANFHCTVVNNITFIQVGIFCFQFSMKTCLLMQRY